MDIGKYYFQQGAEILLANSFVENITVVMCVSIAKSNYLP